MYACRAGATGTAGKPIAVPVSFSMFSPVLVLSRVNIKGLGMRPKI